MFSVVAAESRTPFWVCGGGVRTLQSEPIHADGLGSVTKLTDQAGHVVHSYQYDAWGNIEAETGAPVDGVQYAFTGREWDPETGLYYYRARYLDPKVGRFISEDPIGFGEGTNFYAYVGGNPSTYRDPSGLRIMVPWPARPTPPTDSTSVFRWWLYYMQDALTIKSQFEAAMSLPGPAVGVMVDESWGAAATLARHFADHGADVCAQNAQAEGLPTKIDAEGVIRVYDPATNTFGAYNANGTTRTFFKPTSPTYFARQPGVLVP
jgi:RHS repeat-associated protein